MSATNYQIKPNILAPEIPDNLYRYAVNLFSIQSTLYNETSISIFICGELNKMKIKYSIDGYGNIIAEKGIKNYNCFCCHLDTVHIYKNGFNLYQYTENNHKYLTAKDNDKKAIGIGGDDKCGIFVCLYLLGIIDNIKVIFFSQEESGGIGSSNIDLKTFEDCKFLGSIDRWNGHDFINTYSGEKTISKKFANDIKPILKKYDYSFNSGLFTDSFNVMDRDINLSCFNVSCGYYSHHSDNEYIDLNELYNCCLLCADLCKLNSVYNHQIVIKKKYTKVNSWGNYKYDHWRDFELDYKPMYCKECNIELLQGEYEKGLCYSCQDKSGFRYCEICGVELSSHENRFCFECLDMWKDELSDYISDAELEGLLFGKSELNTDKHEKSKK